MFIYTCKLKPVGLHSVGTGKMLSVKSFLKNNFHDSTAPCTYIL